MAGKYGNKAALIFYGKKISYAKLKELEGCEVHLTHMPTPGDEAGLRKLGVNLTCDSDFLTKSLFLN